MSRSVAATVAARKAANPADYCKNSKCLWRTTATSVCPRHCQTCGALNAECQCQKAPQTIALENEYGARIVYCARHVHPHRQHLYGSKVTETLCNDPCPDCTQEAKIAAIPQQLRDALTSANVSHTRFRYSQVHVYRFDASSPSGFMLEVSATPAVFDAVCAELKAAGLLRPGLSPLSPTEAR